MDSYDCVVTGGGTARRVLAARAPARQGAPRPEPGRKIPLNLFGVGFGLGGLGEFWALAARLGEAPLAISDVVLCVSAVAWAVVVVAYLHQLVRDHTVLALDLRDPVAAPFASLALITPILLSAAGIYPYAEAAGRALTDVFTCLMVLLAGWFIGQWIYAPTLLDSFHPGYFLPTVAGGLVAAEAAVSVSQRQLAEALFGFGLLSWIVVGSLVLGRLFFRPMLPPALRPTLAIEVAPAAVAALAWFQLNGQRADAVACGLAGYGLLMVVAQVRLIPLYRSLPFMPSTWAFAFSWAAVASAALVWLHISRVPGAEIWDGAVMALISILIGAIAVRTLVALVRRQLLPAAPAASRN